MKKLYFLFIYLTMLFFLLIGCSQESQYVVDNSFSSISVEEFAQLEDEIKKEIIITAEVGTPEWTFQHLQKAVANNDKVEFMKFQNDNNPIFYKEQERWMEEVIYKKDRGYSISVTLDSFLIETDSKGSVFFSVKIKHPKNGEFNNTVTYEVLKINNVWVLNDLPFEQIQSESGHITVNYKDGQEEIAKQTLTDAIDLLSYYSENFNWISDPITIKIYSDTEEISATVPWPSLGGWNEVGESLKVTSFKKDDIFRILAHELTHKMLGDLTNDNATLFIQEGFATYLENKVQRNAVGEIHFDQNKVDAKSKKAIEISNSVLSIEELGKIDYTGDSIPLYRDGSLISNYLVKTYGLDKYKEMLNYLSNYEYIDKRMEHKLETIKDRTMEALEKVYGSTDVLSSKYKDFYLK
jgi:hypothetical protein